MLKLFPSKWALFFLGLVVLFCYSCQVKKSATEVATETANKPIAQEPMEAKQPETKPVGEKHVEKKPQEPAVVEANVVPSNIVAKIGDYVITRKELEGRLMMELRPAHEDYETEAEPVDAETVLKKMIAEKAMIIEARKQNYLERETIRTLVKEFRESMLVSSLLERYLQGKIKVSDSEIEEKFKADPNLDRTYVRAMLEREQADKLINQYYDELCKKFHVQKLKENFPKVAEVHQRLLLYPKQPRKLRFIQVNQVENEIMAEEKKIVLAKFDGGEVTLKDWFDTLNDIGPPSRPRDLNTPEGVERLLDRILGMPLFLAEAQLLGLDKDKDFLSQLREEQDEGLLYEIKNEKVKDIKVPTDEAEIIAYFNKNKESFGSSKTVKIDQIWCEDLKTAQKAKAELDGGKDFESVRQQYSLQKQGMAFDTYPGSERIFFKDLWKGEPNEIIGPIKGFYQKDVVKWRVVKILDKKPGEPKEYTPNMRNNVIGRMVSEERKAALEKFEKELLERYPYEIYADRIKDIDPLNIP